MCTQFYSVDVLQQPESCKGFVTTRLRAEPNPLACVISMSRHCIDRIRFEIGSDSVTRAPTICAGLGADYLLLFPTNCVKH